jgi:hypothetical protein
MNKKSYAVYHGCGKKVEYTECSVKCAPPEDAYCNALKGRQPVSHLKGLGAIDHHDLCCFTCLQKWVEAQVARAPKTFLEAFNGE